MPIGTSDQTSVVNGALAELGSTMRVTSINDGSNLAHRAKALWDETAEFMLGLHPWNPAITRALLNQSSDAPAFGRRYAYQLPADCIRWLPSARGDRDFVDCEREGDFLLSDRAPEGGMPCRYVRRILDPRKWSPGMVTLMKLHLAAAMCEGVTQSKGLHDKLLDRASDALVKAKRVDGLETAGRRRAAAVQRSEWLAARGGYRGRRC